MAINCDFLVQYPLHIGYERIIHLGAVIFRRLPCSGYMARNQCSSYMTYPYLTEETEVRNGSTQTIFPRITTTLGLPPAVPTFCLQANIDMSEYTIKVEPDTVGHIAKAIGRNGDIVATARGFGAKDARLKLRVKLGESIEKNKIIREKNKSKKNHKASGVIFSAKNNIEKYKGKRAKKIKLR